MGIPAGGKNYKLVSEQARRISACRLTFLTEVPGAELRQNGAFVQNAITLSAVADERQRALWQDRVRLDDGFWRSLKEHPVPVREEAVRAIGTRSRDAYPPSFSCSARFHQESCAVPLATPERLLDALVWQGLQLADCLEPSPELSVQRGCFRSRDASRQPTAWRNRATVL
jgi:hypothetical protein